MSSSPFEELDSEQVEAAPRKKRRDPGLYVVIGLAIVAGLSCCLLVAILLHKQGIVRWPNVASNVSALLGFLIFAFVFLLMALVFLALWLLPILIAAVRKHPNLTPIIILLVCLGWTYLGWVAALIWATCAIDRDKRYR
jgi:hypothetical protein